MGSLPPPPQLVTPLGTACPPLRAGPAHQLGWAGSARPPAHPLRPCLFYKLRKAFGPLGSEPHLAVVTAELLLESHCELQLVCHQGACGSCWAGQLGDSGDAGPLPRALFLTSLSHATEPPSAGFSAVAMTTEHCLGVLREAHSTLKKKGPPT